jgi:hypothetical protein
MVDAAPGHVGDVQQAVDATQIDECAVLGDVLDDAVDGLTFFEAGDQLGAGFGAGLFENGAARDNDVAAAAVHLEDLEGLHLVHQRADIADRADVDLAARQEGRRAVEIDRVAALDRIEDGAVDLLVGFEGALELDPALFAAGLVAADDRFAHGVLDAVEIDLDLIADSQRDLAAMAHEFLEGHAAFGLEADVDDGHVLLDGDDAALDDRTFLHIDLGEGLLQHRREILARRCVIQTRHMISLNARSTVGWC